MKDHKAKKKYGQNFLTSPRIPNRIVEESGITPECGVLEIGPGLGILTHPLSQIAKKVVAVEIDSDLIEPLTQKFIKNSNVTIIQRDFMDLDIKAFIDDHFNGLPVCVCANIPYYITTPIIMKLLESRINFRTITVMVQREVADRLIAKKNQPDYGAITAVCNYYASVKRLFTVPAGAFSPPPKVNSAVIRFDPYKTPPVCVDNEEQFFKIIHGAFAQRRKILINSLQSCLNTPFTKADICGILNEMGLNPNIRGESLDINDFALISNKIKIT